jgi:heme-degrading monooxygenase HmoA
MTDPFGAHHLAELNIARAVGPIDSPSMADFVANLARVNAIGDASPGFVWRLQDDSGAATSIRAFDDPRVIVNLTVWQDAEALRAYAYHSDHLEVLRRRREWFIPLDGPSLVLWWIPAGHRPTVEEAKARLEHLAAHGPTPRAFTLKTSFPTPGATPSEVSADA